jgi:3-deoxy-D-manno-octulosonic-acid transferase
MRKFLALLLYRVTLPCLFIAAFPAWVVKMLRRGGLNTPLGERVALYGPNAEMEPCGATHIHAISVGETIIALKLIREWLAKNPQQQFVLATGTATGHAVATNAAIAQVRVAYSPLDFASMITRYLDRFEPSRIVLIEGELWPHLLLACRKRSIPVSLVNARMSPRSTRRYRRFANWLRPFVSCLDAVAIQEAEDESIWRELGVAANAIHLTGSIKFDPGSAPPHARRPTFQDMLEAFGRARPIVLAASTHAGEDAWIANAIREAAPHALPVIAPRHAERRHSATKDLEAAGFTVSARSQFDAAQKHDETSAVFLIDTTGELGDWTAHADAVIIGKSFLSKGGQNPAEAILARRPVIFGPHMENFEPLAGRLVAADACIRANDHSQLVAAIRRALDPQEAQEISTRAIQILSTHQNATRRVINILNAHPRPAN